MSYRIKLTDYVDPEYIQSLQDNYSAATSIGAVIMAPDCTPITGSGGAFTYSGAPDSSSGILNNIIQTDKKNKKPGVFFNDASGLSLASVPIVLDGVYLGSWIIGEMRIETGPGNTAHRAPEGGPDVIHSHPPLTPDMFNHIFSFLQTLNITLLDTARTNIKLKDKEKELRSATRRMDINDRVLRAFIDSSVVAMYATDYHTGEILQVNRRYCEIIGLPKDELLGKQCWTLSDPRFGTFCPLCPRRHLLDDTGRPAAPITWTAFNEHLKIWAQCTNQIMEWDNGRLIHLVTVIDVTKEIELRQELSHLAFYDSQTGLPNGQKLVQDFNALTSPDAEDNSPWSVTNGCFFYEIDPSASGIKDNSSEVYIVSFAVSGLRRFSDAYGRNASRDLLASILKWQRERAYPGAALYRIERGEFSLMITGADQSAIMEIANDIRARFDKPWNIDVDGQTISYFCGAALSVIFAAREEIRPEDILGLISVTLDSSRKSNSIAVYDEEMRSLRREHLKFELSLKNCVSGGMAGFDVNYQPIVEILSGTWAGLEALCRWTSPEFGVVSPAEFIPEAESLGLIPTIGLWVLETAVKQCKNLGLTHIDGFFLSVNMSPLQLMDEKFAEDVISLLERNGFSGANLNLEVTESVEFTFNSFTISTIERLRGYGIKIALDDFGTGYATFRNLRNLPLNFVKTEGDFVKWAEEDNYMRYFFHMISEISHANNMALIAEGIETSEQMEIMKNNGADYIQGYFFSKPMSLEQLSENLSRFIRIGDTISSAGEDTNNIKSWLKDKSSCVVTPSLFKLMNKCTSHIMSNIGDIYGYAMALETAARHFGVRMAFAFIRNGDKFCLAHEWTDGSIISPGVSFSGKDVASMAESVSCLLKNDGMITASGIDQLPYDIQNALEKFNAGALLAVPILSGDGVIDGFMGFDDSKWREWTPDEIIMLWNLCKMMSGYVKATRLAVSDGMNNGAERFIRDILDDIGFNVLALDIETDNMLWANEAMRSKSGRCGAIPGEPGIYPIHFMSDGDDGHTCPISIECRGGNSTEHWDRSLVIYDGVIDWERGRKARIELALGTAEHNMTQEQLEYFSAIDPLTGTLNRNALFSKMSGVLAEAHAENTTVSIAFINVDKLKFVNESYGHGAGDMVLGNIVKALRTYIRGDDVLGRIWGDKFVIVFPACDRSVAERRMIKAKNYLVMSKTTAIAEKISFSYGIAQNTELPYDGSHCLDELLNLANRRMMENKNIASINKKAVAV